MATSENLGKAKANVELLTVLPNVDTGPSKFDFNISGFDWNIIRNSQFFVPLLTENITDDKTSFSVCYPLKRVYPVNNYIVGSDGSSGGDGSDEFITWTPIDIGADEGVVTDIFADFYPYTLEFPKDYKNQTYRGPKWQDRFHAREPPSNDWATIQAFNSFLGGPVVEIPVPADTTPIATTTFIEQGVSRDGLWWGVQSDAFVSENMPFWVHIKRPEVSPTTWEFDTYIIIQIGIGSSEQAYDIILSNNNKPRVIDYLEGRSSQGGESPAVSDTPFDTDAARVFRSTKDIEIGVMSVGGRLIVFVNKEVLVYSRIQEDGTLRVAEIAAGSIRVYGTNMRCDINASPMTFAPISVMALPIVELQIEGEPMVAPDYGAVSNDGTFGGAVCKLPTQPAKEQLYGIDCNTFEGTGGNASPSGEGFHQKGAVTMARASEFSITTLPSTSFYILQMIPEEGTAGENPFRVPNMSTPYFFRVQGGYEKDLNPGSQDPVDVSEDVISVNETSAAPDYVHSETSATVVLYNKAGKYDYLKSQQSGITIKWGWNDTAKTFTGLTVSATTNETKGKETIEVQCKDYMEILRGVPILNSPYYDGMISYYAILDLAKRAGISVFVDDWDEKDVFFVPSSYAFSEPKARFESQQTIFDCIKWFAQKDQSMFYFDEEGVMHVEKLPGGLFSSGGPIVAKFEKNPDTSENLILNDKKLTSTLESTVNWLSVYTLDRDTRNAITVSIVPDTVGLEDRLLYKRAAFYDQPALGDYGTAVLWVIQAAQRMFYPIQQTSIVTVGVEGAIVRPLNFVTVDGDEFRCTSVSRKFNADNNDYTSGYECEWLGGEQ